MATERECTGTGDGIVNRLHNTLLCAESLPMVLEIPSLVHVVPSHIAHFSNTFCDS